MSLSPYSISKKVKPGIVHPVLWCEMGKKDDFTPQSRDLYESLLPKCSKSMSLFVLVFIINCCTLKLSTCHTFSDSLISTNFVLNKLNASYNFVR